MNRFPMIHEKFPMKPKDRERLLYSMTPDARARFYEREMKALQELGLLWPDKAPKTKA
jgi:hypothetical protein